MKQHILAGGIFEILLGLYALAFLPGHGFLVAGLLLLGLGIFTILGEMFYP